MDEADGDGEEGDGGRWMHKEEDEENDGDFEEGGEDIPRAQAARLRVVDEFYLLLL